MTEAEKALIEAALAVKDPRLTYARVDASLEAIFDARHRLLLERVPADTVEAARRAYVEMLGACDRFEALAKQLSELGMDIHYHGGLVAQWRRELGR